MRGGLLCARPRQRSHSPLASWPRSIACGDGLSGEFMTSMANLASTEADADHRAADAAEAGPFVLNLCSSTTPMALAQTELPELKRFTFFVSRRFEEGRERFRLHMGFFATQAEAEEWLGVVREIYPGAWAGEAPGKKLRARAAQAAATQARHAVGPQPSGEAQVTQSRAASAPAAARAPGPDSPSSGPVPKIVPTLHPPAAASAAAAPAMAAQRAAAAPSGHAGSQSIAKRSPAKPAPVAIPTAAGAHASPQRRAVRPLGPRCLIGPGADRIARAIAAGPNRRHAIQYPALDGEHRGRRPPRGPEAEGLELSRAIGAPEVHGARCQASRIARSAAGEEAHLRRLQREGSVGGTRQPG